MWWKPTGTVFRFTRRGRGVALTLTLSQERGNFDEIVGAHSRAPLLFAGISSSWLRGCSEAGAFNAGEGGVFIFLCSAAAAADSSHQHSVPEHG